MFSCNAWWDKRTPDKRSETIPSSRITPDPLDSQLHVSASSLQFTSSSTGFRSEDLEELGFVLSGPFLCCFWGLCLDYGLLYSWKIQTWTIIRFQTESVIYWFFNLLVFDRIHDAMCLNKMSRTEKYAHNIKNTAVYLIVHMGYFLSLCSPNWGFAAKKLMFWFHLTIEASPIWSSSRVW